jgi:hypothetical protein
VLPSSEGPGVGWFPSADPSACNMLAMLVFLIKKIRVV